MSSRHQRIATVEEYGHLHIAAAQASNTGLPTTPSASGPARDLDPGMDSY